MSSISVIAPEPKILAQLIGNMAQIMAVAKVDWTMPSFDGWDNSNMAMFSGDFADKRPGGTGPS